MTFTFIDTEETLRHDPEAEAAYDAAGLEYQRLATALLDTVFRRMTGREIATCEAAASLDDSFDVHVIARLVNQYAKEISTHN